MFSRIYSEDIDIVKMFINECKECLEDLKKDMLKLEVNSEDIDLLSHLFRRTQKIKRESSFVGLSGIVRLTYEVECILKAIKDKRVAVDTELIDGVLLYIDFLDTYTTGLLERLMKLDSNVDSRLYLEYEDQQDEKQLVATLRQAYESCEIRDDENSKDQKEIIEDQNLEVLQSEVFNKGLTGGIKDQFLYESMENFDKIEHDLLVRLDVNDDDQVAISEICRIMHSTKASAGIYLATVPHQSQEQLALKKFSEVVHTFENLLDLIRDKKVPFDHDLIDLSFLVVDYLKSFINSFFSEEFLNLQNNDILDGIKEHISQIQSTSQDALSKAASTQLKLEKVDEVKSKSSINQSIRVNQEKIDKMMNMVSELFIAKNSFTYISTKLNLEYAVPAISKEMKHFEEYLNSISEELQNAIMSIRMVEIKTVFQRMPRVVRDIAQSTGKKMELRLEGEDTELDKTIIEQIGDPLVHLIRNAADHGIELPHVRLSKGKPEIGRIVLRAYSNSKYVFIEIEDDGKGIDAEELKEKAIEKGFITRAEAERMTRSQLLNLIFLPGFSTAKQITEISGRGVGMDIVKSNIVSINGNIKIESEVDQGTKMIIQLPLSLAVTRDLISRGLIVEAANETYIIPLKYIVGSVKINRSNIHKYDDKCFMHLRGDIIRIEWLSKVFMSGERDVGKEELNVVILSNGVENFAIVVDKLKNEQEFVVKTLDGHLASIPGISGSTLLGNGQVVLIVNPIDLLQLM
ncbi:chemotaxis protein CheW [Defluviitalea raffinosedens]|uniref:chemotaxis protein CheW n=1 Tax=Defluviitalea raffinosedens TaxID=1450156 RepID=UPI00195E7700|nr:chemotaxis protein CheA [Defluviitalea raffinosedens]MBM7686253.1 two-component system chemotaxis sensor kinase CheA [Defluviitalea raffinosedens]